MKTKYTKHDIEISPIRRKIGKFSLQAYSRQINAPVSQGISNLYHNIFSRIYDWFTPFIVPIYHKVINLLVKENCSTRLKSFRLMLWHRKSNVRCSKKGKRGSGDWMHRKECYLKPKEKQRRKK